jgi:hypothetical protein
LCGNGDPMEFPDRVVPAFGGATCLQLQQFLSGVGTPECEMYRESITDRSIIDILVFCGCEDALPSNYCSPCQSSGVDVSSTRDAITNPTIQWNCSELTVAANHVADPTFCQHLELFSAGCCEVVDEVFDLPQVPCSLCGDASIPLIDPDIADMPGKRGFSCREARDIANFFLKETDTCDGFMTSMAPGCCKYQDRCSLCSDPTSKMLYPEKQLPFTHEGLNCIDVEFGLGYLDSAQCSSFHQATAGVDLASWCGCEDAIFVDPWCSLCGDDLQIVRNSQIPDAPIGITCNSLAEWAPYVQQYRFCQARITVLRGECCGPIPPSPVPSDTPSVMPTAEPYYDDSSTGIAQLVAYRVSVKRLIISLVGFAVLSIVA